MTEIARLIATIKHELKSQGFTYKAVAETLGLSEASVKRLFSSNRLTVDRLAELGRMLGYTLAELTQASQAASATLRSLTHAQEIKLVADPKLLLTAVCLLNHWTLAEIVARYRLTAAECLHRALVLDRMGLVEVLPGNRVRLKISREFDWRPDGAIREFFVSKGQHEFLDAGFGAAMESHGFNQGMLTESARVQLMTELKRLRARFAALHDESIAAPLSRKRGIGLMLAMREWEPAVFSAMRRSDAEALPAP